MYRKVSQYAIDMTKSPRGHRMSPLDHDPTALQYALDKSGLTQTQFAAELKKSQSYVSEILKGTRNANPALLAEMARVLNCPIVVIEAKRPIGQVSA